MKSHTLSLSAALKNKNRIAGEVARLQGILKRDNSRVSTRVVRVDFEKVMQELTAKQNDLLTIKGAIAKANVGIYDQLARLEETKAKIAFFTGLPTQEGEVSTGYGASQSTLKYEVFINQSQVDDMVKVFQTEANDAQDKIDAYNATHSITVDLSE